MRAFAALLDGLVYTQSRNRKLALLAGYFRSAPDPDRGWALAALTDGVPVKLPLRRCLADLTGRFIDPALYKMSRDYVGDTAETVALLWPEVQRSPSAAIADIEPTLDTAVRALEAGSLGERTERLGHFLDVLDVSGRWALLKLVGGAPRAGVSARLAKTALAEGFNHDVAEIEELWHAIAPPYTALFQWLEGRTAKPDFGSKAVFRPVMLAHPIEDDDWGKLMPQDMAAEWKWDGIRVQIAASNSEVRLFSRQGDDISVAFPEIRSAFLGTHCVADGELLVMREGQVTPFNELQQRLNRKTVTAKMQSAYPAHVRLYDLLFSQSEDLRGIPVSQRRARLEAWHATAAPPSTSLSPLVPFETFGELTALWSAARSGGIEGLLLKRKDSPYQAGRIKGQWFKWKRAALTLDCVLMYAQRGSGKRSSFYSDYTFGVWREGDGGGPQLVPVGKAYSGFTDEELRRIDTWVRANTIESFGPVRAVPPYIVFEVAFDAIQPSARHKSGVAMRFPRIHRIRWDKPAAEADTLEAARALTGKG